MLIKMMIRNLSLNFINDYRFAEYNLGDKKVIALLLNIDNTCYYDIDHCIYVTNDEINYQRPLTHYVKSDKLCLSVGKAKKLANPYYDKFINYCKKKKYKDIQNQALSKDKILDNEFKWR